VSIAPVYTATTRRPAVLSLLRGPVRGTAMLAMMVSVWCGWRPVSCVSPRRRWRHNESSNSLQLRWNPIFKLGFLLRIKEQINSLSDKKIPSVMTNPSKTRKLQQTARNWQSKNFLTPPLTQTRNSIQHTSCTDKTQNWTRTPPISVITQPLQLGWNPIFKLSFLLSYFF